MAKWIRKEESLKQPLKGEDIPLPYVFHGTEADSLPKIAKTGLCPSEVTKVKGQQIADPSALYVDVSARQAISWGKFPALIVIPRDSIPLSCRIYKDWNLPVAETVEELAEKGQAYVLTKCGCIPPEDLLAVQSVSTKNGTRYNFIPLTEIANNPETFTKDETRSYLRFASDGPAIETQRLRAK